MLKKFKNGSRLKKVEKPLKFSIIMPFRKQHSHLTFLGRGSLLWYLRRKVWALELIAGNDETSFNLNSYCSMYRIQISLTREGFQAVEKVLDAAFRYLSLLRSTSPNQARNSHKKTLFYYTFVDADSQLCTVDQSCQVQEIKYSPNAIRTILTCRYSQT